MHVFPAGQLLRALVLTLLALVWCPVSHAQQGVTTFGMQIKPVFPVSYFDPLVTISRPSVDGTVELTGGVAYGMSVRIGLTNTISLETGLGQIQRNYAFSIRNDTNGYAQSGRVRYIGYEVPITALVYIRLGEKTFMNAAMGFSADLYPSNVQSLVDQGRIEIAKRWAQLGVLGNMGVEYRTYKSGTFYLGATYHRPFGNMATVELTYFDLDGRSVVPYAMRSGLNGSYLTVDLRYYFHEDPERINKRKKK